MKRKLEILLLQELHYVKYTICFRASKFEKRDSTFGLIAAKKIFHWNYLYFVSFRFVLYQLLIKKGFCCANK